MSTGRNKTYCFSLKINQQDYLRYYQGAASTIQVYTENGQRLRFPASRLRPFLTHTGISGCFQMTVSSDNRFLDLTKLD